MTRTVDVLLILTLNFLYHSMNQIFTPTLPLYVANLGGSELIIGVLVGLLPLGAVFAKTYFGKLATRSTNLFVMRVGLVVATLVLLLYFPFWGFAFLAVVRILQSIGLGGFVTGAQGLLAEHTNSNNRVFIFGLFSAALGLGMLAGPLAGSHLLERFGFASVIRASLLIMVIATVIGFYLQNPGGKTKATENYRPGSPWQNQSLVAISGSIFFAASGLGAISSMLAVHAVEVGLTNSALFFLVFAAMFTTGGAVSGFIANRFTRTITIAGGFCLLLAGLLLLSALSSLLVLLASGICVGFGLGVVNSVLFAMVPDHSVVARDMPNDLAFFSNAFDLGTVLGSLALGWIAAYSFGVFWLVVAFLTSGGLVVFLRFNPEKVEAEIVMEG